MAIENQEGFPKNYPGELVITSINSFNDPDGNLRIVGLVKNKTGHVVSSIQLLVDIRDDSGNSLLRDKSGQVVEGRTFSPVLATLIPEESSPFSFIYNNANGYPASYEVNIVRYQGNETARAEPESQSVESEPIIHITEALISENPPEIPVDATQDGFKVETAEPRPEVKTPENPELDSVVQQFATEIGTNLIATVVAGAKGNILASKSNDPDFNATITAASLSMILQLAARAGEKAGLGQVETNMTSTDKALIIARFIGDSSDCWGVIVLKDSTLGFIRLVMNEYAEKIRVKIRN